MTKIYSGVRPYYVQRRNIKSHAPVLGKDGVVEFREQFCDCVEKASFFDVQNLLDVGNTELLQPVPHLDLQTLSKNDKIEYLLANVEHIQSLIARSGQSEELGNIKNVDSKISPDSSSDISSVSTASPEA